MHRRPGQRPARAAGVRARQRRRRRGLHLEGAERRAEPRLARASSSPRAPATRSGSGSPRSAARRRSSGARTQIARLMRKEGLPLQRVLTHETLDTVATELRLADVTALYAAVGEGNLGAQAVVRRVIELFGGDDGADEDSPRASRSPASARSQAAAARRRGRHREGPSPTSGSSSPGAARRCPATTIIGFVTRGAGVSVHRRDCTNAAEPGVAARADRRGRVGADRAVDVPGRHPGRGPRPGPAALRHHPGAVRHARQHPVGHRSRRPATGSPRAGSPSRWPTPSTSATSSRPSARSTASSTPTASPSSGR